MVGMIVGGTTISETISTWWIGQNCRVGVISHFGFCVGGIELANIKSAMKRARQNEKRRVANRIYRSSARTHIKKARSLIEAGDLDQAEVQVASAISALDKAAQKGIVHRNNAARRKSRLVGLLRKAQAVQ